MIDESTEGPEATVIRERPETTGQQDRPARDKGSDGSKAETSDGEQSRSGAEEAAAEGLAGSLIELDFSVHKSLRYHAWRRDFLEGLHRTVSILNAIAGSASFVAILGSETLIATCLTAVVALASSCDGVLGFSKAARRHDESFRKFSKLARKITSKADPTESDVREWRSLRVEYEAEAPGEIDVLNIVCHNHEAEARGYGKDIRRRVFWHQSLFKNFLTLPPNNFPSIAEVEAAAKFSS